MGKKKKSCPSRMPLTKCTNFQKQMLLKDFPNLQCDPRPSSACITRFLFLCAPGTLLHDRCGKKETTGGGPLPKRKQKVDVCFAKTLSPSRKSMQSKTATTPFTPKIGFYFILMQSATSHNQLKVKREGQARSFWKLITLSVKSRELVHAEPVSSKQGINSQKK